MDTPILYLIPVLLADTPVEQVIPAYNIAIVSKLKYFIVENIRSARRFLKKCNPEIDIEVLTFYELNRHTNREKLYDFLTAMECGESMAILPEAGCPAIADPGSEIVEIAQQRGYKVVPLSGPSSIIMALMASGFNGQNFIFHGYLPIESSERIKKIRQLEAASYNLDQTQIFIETPYRNIKPANDIIQHCKPQTMFCIAINISGKEEYIVTKNVKSWRDNLPDMNKKPTIFLIYKG